MIRRRLFEKSMYLIIGGQETKEKENRNNKYVQTDFFFCKKLKRIKFLLFRFI